MTRPPSRLPAPLTAGTPLHRHRHRLAVGVVAVSSVAIALLATASPASAGGVVALKAPPLGATAADPDAVNVGARLSVSSALWATGIRFYKGVGNAGTHTGTLWSESGQTLATTTFTAETATGWQRAEFAVPVQLSPGTTYTVSYLAPRGHYSSVEGTFANGTLVTANGTTQSRGVYAYASSSRFPTSSWHDSNYFVSVITAAKRPHGAPKPPVGPPVPPPPPPPTATWPAAPPLAGTPAGLSLTPMSGTTITTPGTVIDGRAINGSLTIAAANVIVRNSRVSGSGSWGIYVRSGSATITSTTVSGFDNGVIGDHYTLDRVELTALKDDGLKLGDGVTVTNSWCHDLTPEAGAHADCGQVQAGVDHLVVQHNWFDVADGNAALFIAPDLGPSSSGPVLIDDNVLGGGNYTLFCVDGDNGRYLISDITITRNHFLRRSNYGPVRVNVPVTASGNTWWDTGAGLTIG